MRFSEDHRPPLWMERENEVYGHNLTTTEHHLEELDLPPHRAALESAQSDGATGRRTGGLSHDGGRPAESTRASAHGAPGADPAPTVTPSLTASGGTRLPAPGPNPSEEPS